MSTHNICFNGEIRRKKIVYLNTPFVWSYDISGKPDSITASNMPACRSRGHKFESQFNHITFAVIGHEIISMVIPPFQMILEEHFSVTGENMCTNTG